MADDIFDTLLSRLDPFKDKAVLDRNYVPETIEELPHRREQVQTLLPPIKSVADGKESINVHIHGSHGTGKTAVARFMAKGVKEKLPQMGALYVDCTHSDTQYRVLQAIGNGLIGKSADKIPSTGLPTEEVAKMVGKMICRTKAPSIVILDHTENLGPVVRNVMEDINGFRRQLKGNKLGVIAIDNNPRMDDFLRIPGTDWSRMNIPPYANGELETIARTRADKTFTETVEDNALAACAHYGNENGGSAAHTLDLLSRAGGVAANEGSPKVLNQHVTGALSRMQTDIYGTVIATLPPSELDVLEAAVDAYALAVSQGRVGATTGEVFETYSEKTNGSGLTQRRVTGLISDLDMQGLVRAKVISNGRYGRTKLIKVEKPAFIKEEITKRKSSR